MTLKGTSRILGPLALAVLVAAAAAPAAQAALWPDHVALADEWVFDPYINVDNNLWGSGSLVWRDGAGDLHADVKCGSFTAQLLMQAYPGVITGDVLTALTTSNSPYADQWYNAINTQKQDNGPGGSGIGFTKRSTVAAIQAGDLLASTYTTSGDTGHMMTVKSIVLKLAGTTLPAGKTIAGVGAVNKYEAGVYDATNSPHGAYTSNPAPDTRYKRFNPDGTSYYFSDTGIGSGTVVIYEEVATGKIVAWAWNVSPTTTSYYYAVTPNNDSTKYRPMVAGYLSGPGL